MTEASSKGRMPDIVNIDRATFECTFGRGCEGVCCRNGRPPVNREQSKRIDANIEKFLPVMRVEARAVVEKEGYLSRRGTPEEPLVRVVAGWCVFFNKGCVLHAVGANEATRTATSLPPAHYSLWFATGAAAGTSGSTVIIGNSGICSVSIRRGPMPSRLSLQDEIALARKLMED